jgi:hypothetical protein
MTLGEKDEAVQVLKTMLGALLGTLSGQTGRPGALMRHAVGDLQASAADQISAGTLGLPLLNCFMLAYYAGATLAGMDGVRAAMVATTPVGLPAAAVANAGIRFALGREARILANTVFVSRDDATAAIMMMNSAFEPAEEFAADHSDPSNYQALIALHAAVTRDLSTRARPLPKLVTYSFPRSFPSLKLANRLYADASRADELRMENKAIHPAFMPRAGSALST